MKWLSSWRLTVALFVFSLGLGVYLSVFWTPSRPKVAAAGPEAGCDGSARLRRSPMPGRAKWTAFLLFSEMMRPSVPRGFTAKRGLSLRSRG